MIGTRLNHNHTYLILIRNNDGFACILGTPDTINRYQVLAHTQFAYDDSIITHQKIMNIHRVVDDMRTFIHPYRHMNLYLLCAFDTSYIQEQFIISTHASLTSTAFMLESPEQFVWESQYLYTQDNGMHVFYACGLARERIFQYQLCAHMLNIPLTITTSSWSAHLALYRYLAGAAYHRQQLHTILNTHHYRIDTVCSSEMVYQITSGISIDRITTHPYLKTAIALMILGETS